MYPQQPGWNPAPQPSRSGASAALIAVSVMAAACLGGMCVVGMVGSSSESRREREARQWQEQQQQIIAQQSAMHQAAMQQTQQAQQAAMQQAAMQQAAAMQQLQRAQQALSQPMGAQNYGISPNYQALENQRLARLAIGVARDQQSLIVADANVASSPAPTLTIATVNARDTRSETKAVSMCLVLMNTRPEFVQISRFVINGANGVRLADGSRAQGRCYAASTSLLDRLK